MTEPQPAPTGAPPSEQNPGAPEPAPGPDQSGSTTPKFDQKAFDQGYAKAMDKAKAAQTKADELQAELNKLKNQGKSAEEIQKELEQFQATSKSLNEQLAAAKEFAASLLNSRKEALPAELRELVELAGQDPAAQLKALEKAEAIAKTSKKQLQGGALPNDTVNIDAEQIRNDIANGKTASYEQAVKKHGRAAVDKLVNASK